jgi:antitoxin ParD1/3/4
MHAAVDLGDELERTVARLVREGRYASRDDVLRAGVRALEVPADPVEIDGPDLGDDMEAVAEGLADIEAGRVVPAEEVFARLKAKYSAMARR